MSWDEIAERHGTDKSLRVGFDGGTGHGYMDHYERLLGDASLIEAVLEIGVYEGASLRTWAEIWPEAFIYGVDIESFVPDEPYPPNVSVQQADVRDNLTETYINLGPFDLIVDDSNHLRGVVRAAMDNFAVAVAPGGFYVVEDCRTGWPYRADGMVISTEEAAELLVAHGLDVVEVVPSLLSVDGYRAAMVVAQAPE